MDFVDVLKLYNEDPDTEGVMMIARSAATPRSARRLHLGCCARTKRRREPLRIRMILKIHRQVLSAALVRRVAETSISIGRFAFIRCQP